MKHNKKRNVGIIYELLLRYISNALVENNKDDASKALKIVENRFHKDTELYKEFRLFNALAKIKVSNHDVASKIISEAKSAVARYDEKVLNKEKSGLIRDINHSLNDKLFYYRQVADYRVYGSIQTLINEWKKGDKSNFKNLIQLESQLIDKMVAPVSSADNLANDDYQQADKLVLKLMTEKLNERYSDNLNSEQKTIIRNYSLYCEDINHDKMRDYLNDLKIATSNLVESYQYKTDSEILKEKIATVAERVNDLNTEIIDDELIAKFMTVSKLKQELLKED